MWSCLDARVRLCSSWWRIHSAQRRTHPIPTILCPCPVGNEYSAAGFATKPLQDSLPSFLDAMVNEVKTCMKSRWNGESGKFYFPPVKCHLHCTCDWLKTQQSVSWTLRSLPSCRPASGPPPSWTTAVVPASSRVAKLTPSQANGISLQARTPIARLHYAAEVGSRTPLPM